MNVMEAVARTKPMTADEYAELPDGPTRHELIDGEVVHMTKPGGEHGALTYELAFALGLFVREHRAGQLYAAETGFLLQRNPDTVRAPDVAFIAANRVAEADTPKYIPIATDLVAEVVSPSDRSSDVSEKVQWWLGHGVRLVWVVDPKSQSVTAYHPDGSARVLRRDDALDGGEVLPGFALPLATFFGRGV